MLYPGSEVQLGPTQCLGDFGCDFGVPPPLLALKPCSDACQQSLCQSPSRKSFARAICFLLGP